MIVRKKVYRLLLISLLSSLLWACGTPPGWKKGKPENGHRTLVKVNTDGILQEKKILENDSNYVYLKFNDKGELIDSINFVNNKREGLRIHLADDKVYYETYHRGMLNGLQQELYSNGTAAYAGHLKNGVKIGEWKFFYEDGAPITYEFYDDKGKLLYFIKYTKDKKIKERKGSEIIDMQIDKKQIKLSDTLTVALLLAYPPGSTENKIIFSHSGQDQALEIPVTGPETFFQIVADRKGETQYHIEYQWKMKNAEKPFIAQRDFTLEVTE